MNQSVSQYKKLKCIDKQIIIINIFTQDFFQTKFGWVLSHQREQLPLDHTPSTRRYRINNLV